MPKAKNANRRAMRPIEVQKRYKAKEKFFNVDSLIMLDGKVKKMLRLPTTSFVNDGSWTIIGSFATRAQYTTTDGSGTTFGGYGSDAQVVPDGSDATKGKETQITKGIDRELFFRYSKQLAEKLDKGQAKALNVQILELEKYYSEMVKKGQTSLSGDLMNEILLRLKESAAISAGYDRCVEYAKLEKWFDRIRDGKIALTEYCEFTRPVPDDVYEKKVKAEGFFDSFVVMHCYDPKKLEKDKSLSADQKRAMGGKGKDPILFGVHDGSDRMWFVADWIDEYCDLTFGEVVRAIAGFEAEQEFGKVSSSPKR